MVLVDLQIALAAELHRKAAMLGELLEHVIEKADTSGDLDGRSCIEPHMNRDVGFLRLPVDLGLPGREAAHDLRPGLRVAAVCSHQQAAHAKVAGELEIRFPVTDHCAALEVNSSVADVVLHEPYAGLTALAAIGLEVRTDEYRVELDALGPEGLQNELLRRFECGTGKRRGAQSVLVRHHDQAKAAAFELSQGGEHARHESNLVQ